MEKQLTITEFNKADVGMNDYRKEEVQKAIALAKEVEEFFPAEALVTCSEQDGKLYFEHPFVKLLHKKLELRIGYDSYRKKYCVYEYATSRKCKNVSSSTAEQIRKGLAEPVTMGKLSAKKIQAWVTYYEQFAQKMEEADELAKGKEEKFIESLKGLDVKWYGKNPRKGEVLKNGIEFKFTIHPDYIETKIEVHYAVPDTLKSFLALSANKFVQPKDESLPM